MAASSRISQTMLEFWSTGDDSVRIAAFLAIRKVAIASGGTQTEAILKVCSSVLTLRNLADDLNAECLPLARSGSAQDYRLLAADHQSA
jgi:nucleolar complex protein 2